MPNRRARPRTIGRVSELTIVTPVKKGLVPDEYRTFRQRLIDHLSGFQWRIEAGIDTPPSLIGSIHFARWFLLGPGDPGLLGFTSNFDGDPKSYLRDFSAIIPDDIDGVWGNCEGYPPLGCRDFDRFWRYAMAHRIDTLTFVPAYPDLTVTDIQLFQEAR